jgi:DNA methylase
MTVGTPSRKEGEPIVDTRPGQGHPVAYQEFLAAKAQLAASSGLDADPAEIHPVLKPHQRDAVAWAVQGGRRAIFASFGLGKSLMQLEAERLILAKLGRGRGLIVCPLGVRQEFIRDARLIGVQPQFIRTTAEASSDGIYLTNYESVRDGRLDPRGFDVVSLDEAAILRGFGGTKTFRELMRLYEGTAGYRFVATATPSPNEYIELLSYAAFLDIMDVGQAKTRFFKRDSAHADRLTLHPHMEREFWLWVASWALFLQRPSDLGHSDEGYELPPLDVRWHEVPSEAPAEAEFDKDGRGRLFRNAALGVQEAAREKRDSLTARVTKMREIVGEDPGAHFLLWHDLEAERHAIEQALPQAVTVWGSQDLDERERRIIAFSDGEIQHLATKPVIAGSGCNFQRHCHRAVFTGIGFKFADFIQAIHRIHRFLQTEPVRIDLIYTEAERDIRKQLERKWAAHNQLVARMGEIIRGYGLSHEAMTQALTRQAGVERREVKGGNWLLVNNDAVEETAAMADASVELIVTSIPFSTQYEYTPSYNDFGHTEDNAHFWAQMDYLTPQLLRVLVPGRLAVIHVKDRIVPGGMTGLGFQTVQPFHAEAIAHYTGHGFAYLGMRTVVTDVVRENNQTYRLGWTEQCKDGSRMGCGMPEYLLIFRKPPTDNSDGYADVPVVKDKATYSRSRWQVDAHGYWRSDGNRPLTPADFDGLPHDKIFRLFRDHYTNSVYGHETHVAVGEALEAKRRLPTGFMLLQPPSWHPDVWTDVARMRTLNMLQERHGRQMHLCPLQFDIVERLIRLHSMAGETVFDPFAGIGTVPYMAVKMGRRGIGVELNPQYFADAAGYCVAAEREVSAPTLFDLLDGEAVS